MRRDAKLESKSNILPEFQPTSFHFEAASHRHGECEKSQAEKSRGLVDDFLCRSSNLMKRERECVVCENFYSVHTTKKNIHHH